MGERFEALHRVSRKPGILHHHYSRVSFEKGEHVQKAITDAAWSNIAAMNCSLQIYSGGGPGFCVRVYGMQVGMCKVI